VSGNRELSVWDLLGKPLPAGANSWDLLADARFRAAADKTAVDTNAVPNGLYTPRNILRKLPMGEQIEKRIFDDPDFWKHNAESFIIPNEDIINDYFSNHPDYERALEAAKVNDKLNLLIPNFFFTNFQRKKLLKQLLEKEGIKRVNQNPEDNKQGRK